jgi:hypothetical protein
MKKKISNIGRFDHSMYLALIMKLRKELISCEKEGRTISSNCNVSKMRKQLLEYVGVPLSTFRGTIKQVPKQPILNDMAMLVMDTIFPTFSNAVKFDPKEMQNAVKRDLDGQHKEFLDAVVKSLEEDEPREEQQERRYAGDRNLSRGRYFSVCIGPNGNDSQTLCREIFAYIDSSVPGWAYIGDAWDTQLYQALGGDKLSDELRNCLYVILLEPFNKSEQADYQRAYNPVLKCFANPHGLKLLPIPVRWYDVEIPHVLDMRRPEVQEWLFQFFRAGDGAILVKPGKPAGSFYEMLPAMYQPYRGGSGFTAGIGSWFRTMGVNALVFPSARSNAMIQVDPNGKLIATHGWNLLLYSGSVPDHQVHADSNPWYPFESLGYNREIGIHKEGSSWRITGVEDGYNTTRDLILAALE